MVEHTPESFVQAIRPTLDAFTTAAEKECRQAAESIYEYLLGMVQDYLRENAEWNLGEEVRRCRRIEIENINLREANAKLLEALEECSKRLRNAAVAGGTDEEYADAAVERYSAVIAHARGSHDGY